MSETSLAQSPSTNGYGPHRAILYARVSTDEQSKSGYSIPDQLRELRAYAEREGWRVVAEEIDDGYSGASPHRPALQRIMERAERGEIDMVISSKRDRFFRDRLHRLLFDQDMADLGVQAISLNDTNNIIGDSVLDSFAEYERQQIAERTRAGKRQKARQGKVIATNDPNFGFRYNAARDGYEVDEETMPVVRTIFARIAGGETIWSVVQSLNDEGVPSPRAGRWGTSGRWSAPMIRRIIRSDVYTPHTLDDLATFVEEGTLSAEVFDRLDPEREYGVWRYADVVVPIPSSGIPRQTVERARLAIQENRKSSNAGRRSWTLSGGVIRCAVCGSRMEPHTVGRKNGRHHYYYRCRRAYNGTIPCENRRLMPAPDTEELVWAFVSDLFRDPARLRAEFDKLVERDKAALLHDPDKKARALARRINELDDQKRRATDLAVEGLISKDDLAARLSEIARQRTEAARELESARSGAEHIRALEAMRDELFRDFAAVVSGHLDTLTPEEQHETYRYLGLRVEANEECEVDVSGTFWPYPAGSVGALETPSGRSSTSPPGRRTGTR